MKLGSPETVADYYAMFFAERETPAVFQLSGGMIAFLADAIYRKGETPLITNRHEQASGFAAEGATRVSGKTCVALGTSGPGASNLVTAIASCYFDSVPVLFITGQVNTLEIKRSPEQRQNGFQELDVVAMVKDITKATFSPKTAQEAIDSLHEAWEIANQGRFGPVLIDLPIDIQQLVIDSLEPSNLVEGEYLKNYLEDGVFSQINLAIEKSERPLILVGGGIRLANAGDELIKFVEATQIPVVATLMGLDAVAGLGELSLGFIGSYGNRWANEALKDADLLIVLGSRLDIRQTGSSVEQFKAEKVIIRVDIDDYELNGRVNSEIKVRTQIYEFLTDPRLQRKCRNSQSVLAKTQASKKLHPQTAEQESELSINPNALLEKISEYHKNFDGFVVDVGQHQMWAAQSIRLMPNQRFLTSGGLGAMGFSIPAAIGAAVATKNAWVVILGDGCAQLAAPELQTISEMNLPLVIYVMNNHQHGMVAQFQDENMESRHVGTKIGYSTPDFAELARAYGFEHTFTLSTQEQLPDLEKLLSQNPNSPILVDVSISDKAKALPKMKN